MFRPLARIPLMAIFTLASVMALISRAESPQTGNSGGTRDGTVPAPTPATVRAELPQRLHDLDSPSYQIRRRAARCLECWVGSPPISDGKETGAAVLAEEFQRAILLPELPLEARFRILLWRSRLPAVRIEPPSSLSRGPSAAGRPIG